MHSYADLVKIVKPNEGPSNWRDGSLVRCKYFGRCSGCQYQNITYQKQLELKRDTVIKAYKHFSDLPAELVPNILPTLPSPRQYAYRTKLTPHFETPTQEDRRDPTKLGIGFQIKGRRTVLDIEECPIATAAINDKMRIRRAEVRADLSKFKRGSTLLLRDSLPLDVPLLDQVEAGPPIQTIREDDAREEDPEPHICITDHHEIVRERVSDKFFTFVANSFFQNNNGILRSLVETIRDLLPGSQDEPERYLVDTYCGSGLFAITLAERFKEVAGVEITGVCISSCSARKAVTLPTC